MADKRIAALLAAIFIYALWGTPAPSQPGLAEILIGVLLLAAAGLPGIAQAFDVSKGGLWQKAGKILLLYGASIPVLAGLLAGHGAGDILRDIVPFCFFLLPVFMASLLERADGWMRGLLTMAVAGAGVAFACRVLIPAVPAFSGAFFLPDPTLLANAPTVLFAALFLMGAGGERLYRGYAFSGLLFMALAALPLVTMALIGQRANIGILVIVMAALFAIGFYKNPLRVFLPAALLGAVLILTWPFWQGAGGALARKTELVGFNMRWQEFLIVLESLNSSWITMIFGKGWGATIASPAVGGAVVSFTHSLLTTYWLKTGLVGLCLAVFYLARLAMLLPALLWNSPVLAFALAGPLLIDVFLYASFKSLDFGLVLLLIPLLSYGADGAVSAGTAAAVSTTPFRFLRPSSK